MRSHFAATPPSIASVPFKVGVVLLDNPKDVHSSGIRYLDGEIEDIRHLSDLDTNGVLWVSNIPFEHYYKGNIFKLYPYVRDDQYLRAHVPMLLRELGYGSLPATQTAKRLQVITQNVVDYAGALMDAPLFDPSDARRQGRLLYVLKDHFRFVAPDPDAEGVSVAGYAMRAHMYNAKVSWKPDNQNVQRTYVVPRYNTARKLLSQMYPDPRAQWELVQFPTPWVIPQTGDFELPAELRDRAALVFVNLKRLHPDRAKWNQFVKLKDRKRGQAKAYETESRDWITLQEAIELRKDAHVEVHRAYTIPLAPLKNRRPFPPAWHGGLVSANLIAESALWAVGATPIPPQPVTGHTSIAPFIWGNERCLLYKYAREFANRRFWPTCVGTLQITVIVPNDAESIREADFLAMNLGLEPPAPDLDEQQATQSGELLLPFRPDRVSPLTIPGDMLGQAPRFNIQKWIEEEEIESSVMGAAKLAGLVDELLALEAFIPDERQLRTKISELHQKALAIIEKKFGPPGESL